MKHTLILAILLAVFLYSARDRVSSGPYLYDEADYMYAASLGIPANAFDSPSRSILEFIKIGLDTLRSTRPSNTSLSQLARSGGDVTFYRHTHGPLYYYWLALLLPWTHNEGVIRSWNLIFPVFTALVIYCGCLWLLPAPEGFAAAVLSTSLYLWSPSVWFTREIAPHLMFSLFVLITLFLAAKAIADHGRVYWYAAAATAGFTFAALEVVFVLVAVLAMLLWIHRKAISLDGSFVFRLLLVFGCTVLIIWPAAIFKLSFLKSYMFMAYLAVARSAAWGAVTLGQTWKLRLESSPAEWLFLGIGTVLWFRSPAGRRQPAVPFLLFGALMLLVMARINTTSLRYTLPFLPALHVGAGITVAGLLATCRPLLRAALVGIWTILLAGSLLRFAWNHSFLPDLHTPAVLASVRSQGLGEHRLLVPQEELPTLHYYFPGTTLTGFTDPLLVPTVLEAGQFDAVLYPGKTQFQLVH